MADGTRPDRLAGLALHRVPAAVRPAPQLSASQQGGSLPDPATAELARISLRWQQLPLDRAQALAGRLRALAQSWADRCAGAVAHRVELADLGPATALDQLRVTAYDAWVEEVRTADELAADLARLRRDLG